MALLQIENNPLLQTTRIVKVIREFDSVKDDFVLGSEVPLREVPQDRIAIDVRKGVGGMTQGAQRGAESPMVSFYGVSQVEFEPASWREKVVLTPKEVKQLRELGTKDQVEAASSVISRHLFDLRMRLETRMEWMRWQALYGSLNYAAKDVEINVDYAIPVDMTPTLTGTDKWDNAASDPMDDILEWIEKYRDLIARPKSIMFNRHTQRVVMQNSKIRALRDAMFTGQPNLGNLTPGVTQAVFQSYAGIPYTVYDGGYMEITDLASSVASSGTTLTVRNVGTISLGDSLIITHRDGEIAGRERLSVAAVSKTLNTITVSSPGVVKSAGYPVGSTIRVKKFFIPDGKLIIRGDLPANIEGGPVWAEMIAGNHEYGADPFATNFGMFAKVVMLDQSDPPKMEIIVGVNALPVVYHRDTNVIATIY
jgi:hypothetical protein